MSAELIESIRIYVRYETKNEKGETRRERNENVNELTPKFIIPFAGMYLWDLYFSVSDSLTRIKDSICHPIPPSEFKSYCELTETIVYPHEYDILRKMDSMFCSEMNKELQDYQTRQHEAQKREVEAAKNKR